MKSLMPQEAPVVPQHPFMSNRLAEGKPPKQNPRLAMIAQLLKQRHVANALRQRTF